MQMLWSKAYDACALVGLNDMIGLAKRARGACSREPSVVRLSGNRRLNRAQSPGVEEVWAK